MKTAARPLVPAVMFGLGAVLLFGINQQRSAPLARPLTTLPNELVALHGVDRTISPEEQRVAGMSTYLMRDFRDPADSSLRLNLYVGYYDQQTDGASIHSPRNCLPGAGWEPLSVTDLVLRLPRTTATVRRYLLARGTQKALVYYWYQGRGRVASNEYLVKWDLLRDAALRGRTEEALVRIVVPLRGSEAEADSLATGAALQLVPAVNRVLPAFPGRALAVDE